MTTASAAAAHAEGESTQALGYGSHAEGKLTISYGNLSHAEGSGSIASGSNSHAEGLLTIARGDFSHAEGNTTLASGIGSHAEGDTTLASGVGSHAEGAYNVASGIVSHAEGQSTTASAQASHAEGFQTLASNFASHTEGQSTTASGNSSHAEGLFAIAIASAAHVEGFYTTASGFASHAEGQATLASNQAAHAEGYLTRATGFASHANGYETITINDFENVAGRFNRPVPTTYSPTFDGIVIENPIYSVGVGITDTFRQNAIRIVQREVWSFTPTPVTLPPPEFGFVYFDTVPVPIIYSGADYAEYFESVDAVSGSKLPYGLVVELDNGKIKQCTDPANAIGVITAVASVIGNGAPIGEQPYLTDVWGALIPSSSIITVISGSTTGSFGEIVPRYVSVTASVPTLNPSYNPTASLTPKSDLPQWNVVGLIGQIPISSSQAGVIPSSWTLMKTLSNQADLYLIK
jgi:hypothetical protein